MRLETVSGQPAKHRVIAIRPKTWCYGDDLSELYDYIELGEVFEVKVVEMTRAEIDARPEFTGW
jgi:hypothetical protein